MIDAFLRDVELNTPVTDETKQIVEQVKQAMIAAGYRFERSEDGLREVVYRPDGSIAIIATKRRMQ